MTELIESWLADDRVSGTDADTVTVTRFLHNSAVSEIRLL